MTAGQLLIDDDASVEAALTRGAALSRLVSEELPVALYSAPLQGDALVLGSFQLQSLALGHPSRAGTLRRRSGGATVRAGAGVLYMALALADRSKLMTCPPGRLLNRNVRGVLTGLRDIGARANYFGRDFLSFGAQPAVFAAWNAELDGTLLFEFFISQTRSCFVAEHELSYPPRREPTLRGRVPTTLVELDVSASPRDVIEAIAAGHGNVFSVEWQRTPCAALAPHETPLAPSADSPEDRALHWSSLREEAIGFVSAGVALDGAEKFSSVRVAGDFLAHRGCAPTLERVLVGVSPVSELVARAVDTAFTHAGYDVEGIRDLRTFQDAILDAARVVTEERAPSRKKQARE
jgi:hypothetical protein